MRLASSGEESAWAKTSATKAMRFWNCIVTMRIFRPVSCIRTDRGRCGASQSHADFHDRLDGTLSEKLRACLWSRLSASGDCADLDSCYACLLYTSPSPRD